MAIKYTVTTTTYRCPHCGEVLKIENDEWSTLLALIFFPITIFLMILWGIKMLVDKIFNYDAVKVENPYTRCSNCGKEIRSFNVFEWGELHCMAKYDWAFRYWMWGAYLAGISFAFSLFVFIVSIIENTHACTIISLIVVLISSICLIYIYLLRQKRLSLGYIILSQSDYDYLKYSWNRLKFRNPHIVETVPIKISGTDKIIMPPPQKVSLDANNNKKYEKTLKIWADPPNSTSRTSSAPQGELKSPWDIVEVKEDIPAVTESDQDECDFHLCPKCGMQVFDDQNYCPMCGEKNTKK